VSELLGGPVRDRIRVYSWICGDRPSETAAAAKAAVERGFTAVKMNGTDELQFVDITLTILEIHFQLLHQ